MSTSIESPSDPALSAKRETPIADRWRLVRGANIPRSLRHILLVMMHYQGANSSIWCKRASIADELDVSVDVVSQKLKQLASIGVVTRVWTQRNGKPWRENAIQFDTLATMQRQPTLSDSSECTLSESSECDAPTLSESSDSTLSESSGSVLANHQTHPERIIRHEQPVKQPVKQPKKTQVCVEFDEFWKTYPRKIAKDEATKAWAKAIKLADAETIIAGAERYATAKATTEARYIKHPASWLNQKRWDDEPEQPQGCEAAIDDWDDVSRIVQQEYCPAAKNIDDLEPLLTPEQFAAVKAVGPKRVAESDRFDKSTPALYRTVRGQALPDDDWYVARHVVVTRWQPDLRNVAELEAKLTRAQFAAVKAVGIRRVYDSDQYDKATPAAYRAARQQADDDIKPGTPEWAARSIEWLEPVRKWQAMANRKLITDQEFNRLVAEAQADRKPQVRWSESLWPNIVKKISSLNLQVAYSESITAQFGPTITGILDGIGVAKIAASNDYQLSQIQRQFFEELNTK